MKVLSRQYPHRNSNFEVPNSTSGSIRLQVPSGGGLLVVLVWARDESRAYLIVETMTDGAVLDILLFLYWNLHPFVTFEVVRAEAEWEKLAGRLDSVGIVVHVDGRGRQAEFIDELPTNELAAGLMASPDLCAEVADQNRDVQERSASTCASRA
jgi:hypothetical protein